MQLADSKIDTSGQAHAPTSVSYEPGLDGLRAVALLAIFVVHANIGWAPGGFLAVSTFFTLSGFLIMALLVKERDNNGRINLGAFWQRRARRLLPASLLAILLIAVVTLFLGDSRQIDLIGGDVISALTYVANWRFILQETTYAGAFGGQSPLLHFWSLAIEEQFYLLFPLIMAAAMAVSPNWRRSAAIVLLVGIGISLIMGIITAQSEVTIDRLYFRTDIRAGELLVGAFFGLWWVERGRVLPARVHQLIRLGGALLLVIMVALIATSDYRERFWYQGGLITYSLITVGVILAALESRGVVRQVLSWPPLVHIGVVSYGAYLVHWPLFMWLYTETSISGGARLVGGTALAIAIATASHYLVELPIRQKRFRFPSPHPLIGIGCGIALAAVLVAYAAPKLSEPDTQTLEKSADDFRNLLAPSADLPGEAPHIGVFGDSTALMVALGLAYFDDNDPTIRAARGWAHLGCTPSSPASFVHNGKAGAPREHCKNWIEEWRTVSDAGLLDAAVVQFGPWEVKPVKVQGADSYTVVGEDLERDVFIAQRITQGLDALAMTPLIIILTSPYIDTGRINGRSPAKAAADANPARMDRLNEIILEVASRYPNVAIVDLATWFNESKDDNRLRPDGVHLTNETALELAPRFAATFAAIVDVFEGGQAPEDTSSMFPVLRYIPPQDFGN